MHQPKGHPACQECPLYSTGIPIYDAIPLAHDWCGLTIIGEAPGRLEVEQSAPFVGPSGKLLWATMKEIWGVERKNVHVTNCVRCGLPGGRKLPDSQVVIAEKHCMEGVLENLYELGPKCVLLVGAHPLHAMTGLKGIDKFRGTLTPMEGHPWHILSTLHPAGLLRVEARRIMWELFSADIGKAIGLARGDIEPWEPKILSSGKPEKVLKFLREIWSNNLSFALDVETQESAPGAKDGADPLNCALVTIGIAASFKGENRPRAMSIPYTPNVPGWYSMREWDEIASLIRIFLEDTKQPIVFHNMPFDIAVMRRHFDVEVKADCHDTILLHHASFPKLPKKLQQVASHFLAIEAWKDDFRASQKDIEKAYEGLEQFCSDDETDDLDEDDGKRSLAKRAEELQVQEMRELQWYNAFDAGATIELYHRLRVECEKLDVLKVYEEDRALLYETINWTRTGIQIDMARCAELVGEYRDRTEEGLHKLRKMTGLPPRSKIERRIEAAKATLLEAGQELKAVKQTCPVCGKACGTWIKCEAHVRKEHGPSHLFELTKRVQEVTQWVEDAKKHLKAKKKDVGWEDFNPASPIQLENVLLYYRKLTPSKVTKKTGKVSTAKASLWELREDPFVAELIRWRETSKILSTYLIPMPNKVDREGRLHPTWKLHATPSGRFGTQPAVQNWPEEMKSLMVAAPGFKIVGADFAALELRISALLAGQQDLIDAFNTGEDRHTVHAHWFFPDQMRELEEIVNSDWATPEQKEAAKHEIKELRGSGKNVTFSKIYRAGVEPMYTKILMKSPHIVTPQQRDQLRRNISMMSRVLDGRYPNMVKSAELWQKEAEKNQLLRTALVGRIRKWPMGEVSLNEACNHPIQGLASDIVNRATMRLTKELKSTGIYGHDARIILQVHDAIYLEARDSIAPGIARSLENCLTTTLTVRSHVTGKEHTMNFTAEAKIGASVGDV